MDTASPEELIDVEEWAKAGRKPRPAKTYRIRMDKEKKDVPVPAMKGREILAVAARLKLTTRAHSKMTRDGQPLG